MTSLMIADETLLLQEADFPDYFVDKHHPDDYKTLNNAIDPEFIFHRMTDHNRIIIRISIKITPRIFIPVTFVCDTGAPSFIYINKITRRLIKDRIHKDDDNDQDYIIINNKRMAIKASPAPHEDCNIIGLLALSYFKMFFEENGVGFNFDNLPNYF
jgi:hypothetical protein